MYTLKFLITRILTDNGHKHTVIDEVTVQIGDIPVYDLVMHEEPGFMSFNDKIKLGGIAEDNLAVKKDRMKPDIISVTNVVDLDELVNKVEMLVNTSEVNSE